MSTPFSPPDIPPESVSQSSNDQGRSMNAQALRMAQFALDRCQDGIFWTTPQAKIIYINEQACRSLGYTRDELLQMSYWDLAPEIFPPGWKKYWTQAKQHGGVTFESRHHRKDGSLLPVAITANYLEFQDEEYCCLVVREITERNLEIESMHRFQEDLEHLVQGPTDELQQTQHLLQEVIDSSPDWIFVKNLEHRFILVNRSFASSQRLNSSDMIGHPDTDFWSQEFCEGNKAKGTRGFHADDREAFNGHLIHNPHDPATLYDGTVRVFDTYKGPLRDKEGRIYGVLCYCRDVTEQREAEAKLQKAKDELEFSVTERTEAFRQSQQLLENIVENIPLAIFIKDPKDEFRIRLWNKGAEAIFGIPRHEMIGRNAQDFWPQEQADFYLSCDRKTIEDGVLQDIPEEPSTHREHGNISLHTRKVPLYNEQGQPVLLLALCEDITERKRKELEQAQHQLLITLMLNTGPGCIKRVAADGTLLQMNPTGLRLVEADQEEEALGLSVFDLVAPEHRQTFEKMHQSVLNGREQTLQFEVIGLKGTRRWMETYATPFRNPITNQVEHLAVTHDISARKQDESSLQFFKHLIAQTDDAIYWLSPEEGFRIVYVNEAACRHYGYSREELLTMSIPDWDPNFSPEACVLIWQDLKEQRSKTFETLHRLRNGNVVPVEVTANYVAYDRKEYIAGTIKDISARKKSEKMIEQLLRQNQLILNSAGEGIYGLDIKGLTTFVNPAAAKMLGYEPNELIGIPMHITMHHTKLDGSPYPTEECPMHAAFKDGAIHHIDSEVLWRKDGTCFPVEYTSTPIRNEHDNLIGAVVTFSDITERKSAEKSLEISEQAIRELHAISSDSELLLEEQMTQLLQLGCRRFGLSTGILTQLNGDEIEIIAIYGSDKSLVKGKRLSLTECYCNAVLEKNGPVSFEHAGKSDWKFHPGYSSFKWESYMGTKVLTRESTFGTLAFGSMTPLPEKFTKADLDFLQLMARWIGRELARSSAEQALRKNEEVLRHLVEGVSSGTGPEFFERLIPHLGQTLSLDYAYIGEVDETLKRVRTLVLWGTGKVTDNIEYALENTPCQNVTNRILSVYPSGIQRLFPKDHLLAELGVDAYIGLPLQNADGKVIGIMVGLGKRPFDNPEQLTGIFKICAARVAGELDRLRADMALRDSESKLQAVIDGSLSVIYIKDIESRYLKINRRYEELFNVKNENIVGLTDFDIFSSEFAETFQKNDRAVLTASRPQIFEEVAPHPDGPHTYLSNKFAFRNTRGEPYAVCGISIDITELKQKEAELRNSEERIRRILDTLPTAAYTFDRDGLITYFNQPAVALWGRTPKLNNPEDRFCGSFKMYTPDGTEISRTSGMLTNVIEEGLSIDGQEVLLERPDGSFRSILSHANPLRDPSGQIIGGVNVLIDLTEFKKMQSILEKSERSIRELYEITSSQSFKFDQKIRALLELGCRRLGLPLGTLTKLVGEHLELEFLHDPDGSWTEHSLIPICQSFCGITLQRSEPLVFEHAGQSTWKTSQAYQTLGLEAYLGTKVTVGGKVYGSLCFLNREPHVGKFTEPDVDFLQLMARWIGGELERKQAEEALQEANDRLQTLSHQLLTIQETERRQLAHDLHDEIGQTLTAVKINLQTLNRHGATPGAPEILQDSMQILDYMLKHVRELSLDLRPSMLDDLGLIPAVRWFVNRQAERAGWKVEIRIDNDLPLLSGDQATACFRVIQEALTNVMRHAQATHVQVDLQCKNENLEILITDNGIGFDFMSSVEQSFSGQNFGLLSMQERVRFLKGHLNIISQQGKGTKVQTRIPLKILVKDSKV